MDPAIWQHTLGDLTRRSAARTPAALALQCGSIRWSYAAFDEVCSRLAAGLEGLGISPGDRVAVLARNSHAFAALRFAVAKLGAVLVPVNFMLKAPEIAYVLQHSGARLLCVDATTLDTARQAADLCETVETLVWLPGEAPTAAPRDLCTFEQLLAVRAEPSPRAVDGGSLAQIIYTSGTESLPKGAMLTHDAVLWNYVTCIVEGEMTAADVVLHALPLFHCAQLDAFLGPCLYVGASNLVTSVPTPERLLPLMAQHGVTSFFAPPTVWIALLRSPLFDSHDLSRLRKGYYGASIMPVEVLLEIQRRLPQLRLWNFYGQTEIAPVATVLKPEDQLRKAGSAGRPALNVETRVVDEEGVPVSPGQIGEIVHRSPQLLRGYYHDEARTHEAFAGGWFHSGDLATVDAEGYITVVDRKKDMIKSGGENVSSREVEEVIYRLAAVSEVAIVGLPHPRLIEAVTAIVVVKPGQVLSARDILAHCATQLAGFKVPKRVVFATDLPRNPSGKLLKRELRRQHAELYALEA